MKRRNQRAARDLVPVRVGEHRRCDVREIDEGENDEGTLDDLVVEPQNEEEDGDDGDRNGGVSREPENLRGGGDAGELGCRQQRIDEEEQQHRDERDAYAETLAK